MYTIVYRCRFLMYESNAAQRPCRHNRLGVSLDRHRSMELLPLQCPRYLLRLRLLHECLSQDLWFHRKPSLLYHNLWLDRNPCLLYQNLWLDRNPSPLYQNLWLDRNPSLLYQNLWLDRNPSLLSRLMLERSLRRMWSTRMHQLQALSDVKMKWKPAGREREVAKTSHGTASGSTNLQMEIDVDAYEVELKKMRVRESWNERSSPLQQSAPQRNKDS